MRRDYIPHEHDEQVNLIRWATLARATMPELVWLYAIPNGGDRHPIVAARLKAEGVRKGVPDLALPVARGQWHGLFIEMKRQKGGRVAPEQKTWIAGLSAQGYRAVVCEGWEHARQTIIDYMGATNGRDEAI